MFIGEVCYFLLDSGQMIRAIQNKEKESCLFSESS
jgi:hypothetical protein